MTAFTEEQQAILREAFHHVWSRMEVLRDGLIEDNLRLASAVATLSERGLLTADEMERIAAELHVKANLDVQHLSVSVTEQEVTAAILRGDLDAFRRQQAREEED